MTGSPASAKWELLEMLAAVILAAESLRIVGSVTAGIINGATASAGSIGQSHLIGGAMETATGYSDGPGIVLLLVSLALLWWRAEYWTGRLRHSVQAGFAAGDRPAEATQLHRLRSLTRWTVGLFILAAAGAVAYFVGNVLVLTAGGVSSGTQWTGLANDAFPVAYLIIALAGVVASRRLVHLCDADLAVMDGAT
jgi:hypothetical protein